MGCRGILQRHHHRMKKTAEMHKNHSALENPSEKHIYYKHGKRPWLSSEKGLLLGFFVECKAARLHHICKLFHSLI